jgi:hypothetical protein
MNELMVVLKGGQWIYFPTEEEKAEYALQDFYEKCDMLAINMDNVKVSRIVLRDPKYNDIDAVDYTVDLVNVA